MSNTRSKRMGKETMKPTTYKVTPKGKDALQHKLFNLSAKQRQFLFLVNKKDGISEVVCKHLAQSINVKHLEVLGLIIASKHHAPKMSEVTQPKLPALQKSDILFESWIEKPPVQQVSENDAQHVVNDLTRVKDLLVAEFNTMNTAVKLSLDDLPSLKAS